MWEFILLTIAYWDNFILNTDIHKDAYKKDCISCHHFIFWLMTISISPFHTEYYVISLWINQQHRFTVPDSTYTLTVTWRRQPNSADLLLEIISVLACNLPAAFYKWSWHELIGFIRISAKTKQQIKKNTNRSCVRKLLCLYSTSQQCNTVI